MLFFLSPVRVAFRWNQKKKKKKKEDWFKFNLKVVDLASAPHRDRRRGARLACCTCSWLDVFTVILREGGRRTFSFCAVWWKKMTGSTSQTIRCSKSMILPFMHICQSFEQIPTPSCDDQATVFLRASYAVWSQKNKSHFSFCWIAKRGLCWQQCGLALTKPGCVLTNQAFDLESKHVWASHLANDLSKTNAFAMLIGSRESKTFFHCEERSCTRKSLTFVATASCFTLSSFGNKKLKKKKKKKKRLTTLNTMSWVCHLSVRWSGTLGY